MITINLTEEQHKGIVDALQIAYRSKCDEAFKVFGLLSLLGKYGTEESVNKPTENEEEEAQL